MLAGQHQSRQPNLLRLKNAFNQRECQNANPGAAADSPLSQHFQVASGHPFGLYSVSLSDSIRSLETLSPGLYNWLCCGDYAPKSPLKFYLPSGLLIHGLLPKHLTEPYEAPTLKSTGSSGSINSNLSISAISSSSSRKQTRKPVEPYPENGPVEVKRFFLNVMELEFSKQLPHVEDVVCIVTMAKQKRTTSCLPLGRALSGQKSTISAMCMESFVFDVPRGQGDVIISILVYSKSQDANTRGGTMAHSPSNVSINSNSPLNFKASFPNLLTLKRSGTIGSINHNSNFEKDRTQAEAGDIGIFIADLTIVVPSNHAFGKIDSWHPLVTNKKNIGRVQLQMGIYSDIHYTPMPEVPSEFAESLDHVNFYLLTRGGLIWDKKWVVASPDGLFVYSAEHRQNRPPMAWIPFKQITKVSTPKASQVASPFVMSLTIALPWKDDTSIFSPTPLSSRWKDEFVEGGIKNGDKADVYISAESDASMKRWMAFLECHIARHHRRT